MKMLFFAFAILVTQLALPAKAHAETAFTVAPVLGLSSFSIQGADISGSRSGSLLGVQVDFPVMPNLLAETGLEYFQAGAKNDSIFASTEYELNYLAVPVGAKYFFADSQTWYARGGLTLAYLMNAKSKTQVFGVEQSSDSKDQMNSFDILPYVGVGYAWQFTQGQTLNVDLNYTRGLLNVLKSGSSHSQGFLLNVSYAFAL